MSRLRDAIRALAEKEEKSKDDETSLITLLSLFPDLAQEFFYTDYLSRLLKQPNPDVRLIKSLEHYGDWSSFESEDLHKKYDFIPGLDDSQLDELNRILHEERAEIIQPSIEGLPELIKLNLMRFLGAGLKIDGKLEHSMSTFKQVKTEAGVITTKGSHFRFTFSSHVKAAEFHATINDKYKDEDKIICGNFIKGSKVLVTIGFGEFPKLKARIPSSMLEAFGLAPIEMPTPHPWQSMVDEFDDLGCQEQDGAHDDGPKYSKLNDEEKREVKRLLGALLMAGPMEESTASYKKVLDEDGKPTLERGPHLRFFFGTEEQARQAYQWLKETDGDEISIECETLYKPNAKKGEHLVTIGLEQYPAISKRFSDTFEVFKAPEKSESVDSLRESLTSTSARTSEPIEQESGPIKAEDERAPEQREQEDAPKKRKRLGA